MKEPRWIRFEERPSLRGRRTRRWAVVNKERGDHLGEISWYGPFRQYSFCPSGTAVFERQCLRDIANFCELQTRAHRAAKAAGQ